MRYRGGYVYILTNKQRTVLYTGVTNNVIRRIWEHKYHAPEKSFVSRYNVRDLIYFEFLPTIVEAIAREKQIKSWKRKMKDQLIDRHNPERTVLAIFPDDGGLPDVVHPNYDLNADRDI